MTTPPLANDWADRLNRMTFPDIYYEMYDEEEWGFFPEITLRTTDNLPYSPAPYSTETATAGEEDLPFVRNAFLAPTSGGEEYTLQGSYYYLGGDISSMPDPVFPYTTIIIDPDITMEELETMFDYAGGDNDYILGGVRKMLS